MLGTYAAAAFLIAISVPLGAAVLVLSGRRRFSWLSAPVGLAAATIASWWLVRLPGEGLTALIVLSGAAAAASVLVAARAEGTRAALLEGAPVAAVALAAASIPFAAEGHFGILGTGFNVDMSQHLFVADWISTQLAPAPALVEQGYPVGPHALAVAAAELGGNLALAFGGVTIAVPVLVALGAVAALRPRPDAGVAAGGDDASGPADPSALPLPRAVAGATLVAFPYLIASYLAQGSFKELYLAAFVVGFAIWLLAVRRDGLSGPLAAAPGAVLAAGALYAYSAPALAWIAGALGAWALLALLGGGRVALALIRRSLPALAVGAVLLAALAAPEAGRIAEFGGSAGSVASAAAPASDRGARNAGPPGAGTVETRGQAALAGAEAEGLDLFDDSLGNLFGQISPLEAFGVWPSGDFRVAPGDGAVPALAFYVGALLGALALALAVPRVLRLGGEPLLAALVAAVAIWAVARAVSTPYTAAKALAMIAPLLSLTVARGLLGAGLDDGRSAGSGRTLTAVRGLAAIFLVAALGSSALALANAPVGPERYTAGIGKLRDRLAGEPVLLLAPPGQLADRHGAAYYGWELRGARPICVEPAPEGEQGFDRPPPAGIRWVIALGGKREPPFTGLRERERRRRVALWEVPGYGPDSPAVAIDPDVPTRCELDPP